MKARVAALEGKMALASRLHGLVWRSFEPDCICFPVQPTFAYFAQAMTAMAVLCPVHKVRLSNDGFLLHWTPQLIRPAVRKSFLSFLAKWPSYPEQYEKAWKASFPEDLWPAEEFFEKGSGLMLRLKDGRELVSDPSFSPH